MKILLVFPKVNYADPTSKKDTDVLTKIIGGKRSLNLTLSQVAALTPEEYNVQIIDENYEKLDFNNNVDLVGITSLTMCAPRAYEIADKYRSNRIPVVLGGNHPTVLPKEAKKHADAVVIGEAENIWQQLLSDFKKDKLKPFYTSRKNITSKEIPEPRRDLLNKRKYSDGILINRGCPNRCEFCFITNTSKRTVRPIENVLSEINKISSKVILIYDSNFTWNVEYNKRLLVELKKFKKKWLASGTINILGKNDEFLRLAKEAGLFSWCIGFESISQRSLDEADKKINQVDMYLSAIKKIKKYGQAIVGSFIFGFDNDMPNIFELTYNTIEKWDIDAADFHILTPFPGTPLYKRLKKEGRILSEDWNKYNLANAVFQPKNMSAKELFEGTQWIIQKYYSIPNIIKRIFRAMETTNDIYLSYYVLQLNFRNRSRLKKRFNF
jgi:radical SAM superfamily enzyme YgiQ (UPF0313 family)